MLGGSCLRWGTTSGGTDLLGAGLLGGLGLSKSLSTCGVDWCWLGCAALADLRV